MFAKSVAVRPESARRLLLGLSGLILLAALPALPLEAGPTRAKDATSDVRVQPGPGSVLKWNDALVVEVRDSLSGTLRQTRTSLSDALGDVLAARYGNGFEENIFPPQYVYRWVVDHWEVYCVGLSRFEIDFGQGRTVVVELVESQLMV